MRAGRWWSGVGWAARLRDATAPTVRCSPRRSAEHQLAMATCDSDADDQIMNLQTWHARRRARQQRDRCGRSGCSGALCVTAVLVAVVAAAWRVSGDFRRHVLETSLACVAPGQVRLRCRRMWLWYGLWFWGRPACGCGVALPVAVCVVSCDRDCGRRCLRLWRRPGSCLC